MKLLISVLIVLSIIYVTESLIELKRDKKFYSKFKNYIQDTIYSMVEEPNPIFKKNKGIISTLDKKSLIKYLNFS